MSLQIHQNFSLKNYHTFGAAVSTRWFLTIDHVDQIAEAISIEADKHLILGGGSNILFVKDFEGVVIHNKITGIHVIDEDENTVTVEAGGGVNWHKLVNWTLTRGYGGIENLSLIPGTVGAAPIQNIGAYGVEFSDVFVSLDAVHLKTLQTRTFSATDCQFGYRQSVFKSELKGQYLVNSVRIRLTKHDHRVNVSYGGIQNALELEGISEPDIQDISRVIISIRQSKLPDPNLIGNAGSFFKNPVITKADYLRIADQEENAPFYPVNEQMVKIPAAWLIEQSGWKGRRIGDAGTYSQHALVLVNHGNATGKELWSVATDIISAVQQRFQIQLEPEVNVI